jgi:broad specificity phosphatase PhoE
VGEWLQSFLAAHVPGQPGTPDPSATILVVSHGAYLSALLGSLLSQPISFVPDQGVDAKKHCLNTCVMRVQADYDEVAGMWRGAILSWGEVDHLGDQAKDIGVADDLRQSFRMATAKLSQ